eukprot:2778237-Prymnesium_polylepis.1
MPTSDFVWNGRQPPDRLPLRDEGFEAFAKQMREGFNQQGLLPDEDKALPDEHQAEPAKAEPEPELEAVKAARSESDLEATKAAKSTNFFGYFKVQQEATENMKPVNKCLIIDPEKEDRMNAHLTRLVFKDYDATGKGALDYDQSQALFQDYVKLSCAHLKKQQANSAAKEYA